MARITNQHLADMIESLDGRVGRIEDKLMNGQRGSMSPTVILLIKWVVFPLIVILGAVFGVVPNLPMVV